MIDLFNEFSLILVSKISEKSIKKIINVAIKKKMEVGMDFGKLLGRLLLGFGVKLGGK